MLVVVPTPESIASFQNLSAARAHLNDVSRQLTEALALRATSVAAEQRYRDLQKEWDEALRALEKATDAFAATIRELPSVTPCQQKSALMLEYSDLAHKYCEAVTQLQRMAQESTADYDRLHDRSEECRVAVEAAREAMEAHVTTHGC
jgi:DNA repair ATPase RecN